MQPRYKKIETFVFHGIVSNSYRAVEIDMETILELDRLVQSPTGDSRVFGIITTTEGTHYVDEQTYREVVKLRENYRFEQFVINKEKSELLSEISKRVQKYISKYGEGAQVDEDGCILIIDSETLEPLYKMYNRENADYYTVSKNVYTSKVISEKAQLSTAVIASRATVQDRPVEESRINSLIKTGEDVNNTMPYAELRKVCMFKACSTLLRNNYYHDLYTANPDDAKVSAALELLIVTYLQFANHCTAQGITLDLISNAFGNERTEARNPYFTSPVTIDLNDTKYIADTVKSYANAGVRTIYLDSIKLTPGRVNDLYAKDGVTMSIQLHLSTSEALPV